MEFCDNCGSRMIRTKEGFLCPRCKKVVPTKLGKQLIAEKRRSDLGAIYVSGSPASEYSRVSRKCPKCSNREAFHWLSGVLGEHAGVRRERTVEHFRCTKCSHSWTEET